MSVKILQGDCLTVLKTMPDASVHCCVTSPPYWGLRSYLPGEVTPQKDCPEWVIKKLKSLSVFPLDNT